MGKKSKIIEHIEAYLDSSTPPSQQVLRVNAIASYLINDGVPIDFLVKEMGLYLTTTDHILRARGILLLAKVVFQLQLKPLDSTTIHTLVGFFTERLTDWRALQGALVGCLALVRRKSTVGAVAGSDAKALAHSYLENLQVQSLGQQDRKLCFELLERLLELFPDDIYMLGDHLVYGICEAIEGEKDPECLIHVFHIVAMLGVIFPDPAGPVASVSEDLFDIVSQYFPIQYTHPKNEDVNVSRDDLSMDLMMAFSSSPFFEPKAVPMLLEKLSSALPLAKLDSLKYLSFCAVKYGPKRMANHGQAIWSSLRAIIFNFQEEHSLSVVSDLANGIGFQESEVTKEAVVLLQTIVSELNNGFLDLILDDEEIGSLMISLTDSGVSKDSLLQNQQRLFAVGCVFSVLARASAASCNRLFETVFVQLLNALGIHPNNSQQDATATHTDVHHQRLIFFALYLSIQILSACRELAVCSMKLAGKFIFVEDTWSQMLNSFSGPLAKTFVPSLTTSSSSTDVYEDANISLRVKGLQVLASFPGGFFPVSKSIFENSIGTLVSIITENFELTSLWKMSLNALAKIGGSLEEYPDPEKSQSYISNVVERLISLISMDDHTMPYPLILEAIADIGASGHMFMSRIIRGVHEAISAKFSEIYVNGDLNVSVKLEHLLNCYSNKLLPCFRRVKGYEDVPLCFAMDIWEKIEPAMTVSSYVLSKDLLKATMTALKLAVAICSVEDQFIVVENAFRVISSNESFSPYLDPSQLKGLQVTQETDGFTCRDMWLISLFASVIIALRQETQISSTRAVIQLLLTAYLKGNKTSAQALGSIVNKMPLKDTESQNSSSFSLDDALELIFKMVFGRCDAHTVSSFSEIDLADSVLSQNDCISGFAWIGKGLVMRGHGKVKEITMILFKCLVASDGVNISSGKQSLSEKIEDVNVLPSVMKYAADAFHVLMSDFQECLNKTFHATARPLYKQRFLSILMPILLSASMKPLSNKASFMLFRAVGHVLSDAPLAAVLNETKLFPILVDVIDVLSNDILNKDMVYNLLLVLSGLLMEKKGLASAIENSHVVIHCLTSLVIYPHKMLVRETAVQCLAAMSRMPHSKMYPLRTQVLRALSKVLDDPKRAVRREAVRCRQAWASIV